jgi:hypothetical protein
MQEERGYARQVTFAAQTTIYKKGVDPEDRKNWVIESEHYTIITKEPQHCGWVALTVGFFCIDIEISEESKRKPIPLSTEDCTVYLNLAARNLEGMMMGLELKAEQQKEPNITAAPSVGHLH